MIEDANKNGRLDSDEKGMAGIVISDGVQFVETGKDGAYELKVAPDPMLPYQPAQVIADELAQWDLAQCAVVSQTRGSPRGRAAQLRAPAGRPENFRSRWLTVRIRTTIAPAPSLSCGQRNSGA